MALVLAAVVLYGVAPAVLEVLGAYRRLRDADPGWGIVVVVMSAAGVSCMVALQRLALRGAAWFPVATSQLAGAAFSKVVPGGSAAAAALQARMLAQAGLAPAAIATGLTVGALLLLGALAGLPVLALPAVLLGRRIPDGLLQAAGIGLAVFVCLFAVAALLLANDRSLSVVGRAVRAADRRLRRGHGPSDDLPERLFDERDLLRRVLRACGLQSGKRCLARRPPYSSGSAADLAFPGRLSLTDGRKLRWSVVGSARGLGRDGRVLRSWPHTLVGIGVSGSIP